MSACGGGAGDGLYWFLLGQGGLCRVISLFPAVGINAGRHPDTNSGDLSGFNGEIQDGHLSHHLGERFLPISESPSTHGSDSAPLSALHQGVLGSQGIGSSVIPAVLLK